MWHWWALIIFFLILEQKLSVFHHWVFMLVVCLLYITFIILRYISSIQTLLRGFYHKRMLDDMASWVVCMSSSPSSPSTSSLSWLFSKCEEYIIKYLSFIMWTVPHKYKHTTFYCSSQILCFSQSEGLWQ